MNLKILVLKNIIFFDYFFKENKGYGMIFERIRYSTKIENFFSVL
jgi:hypothetical protein